MIRQIPLTIFRHKTIRWFLLFAFFGACFIFLWPRSTVLETNIFIPVEIERIPGGLALSTPPLKGIDVRVRGPKYILENLPSLKLRYMLDLSGSEIGVRSIPVNRERIPFPKEVSIKKTTPTFLTIRFEKQIRKNVPVVIAILGKPAAGYFVADTMPKPATIALKGPESILGAIEQVTTKPIDVNGLSESFKKEIALDLSEGLQIEATSGIVLSEIFIEEKIDVREFADIPVEGKNTPYVYTITPPAIHIQVKGPENILEKLSTGNGLNVYVDLKELKPGVYVRCATINLPLKTSLAGVKPEIFTVKISGQIRETKPPPANPGDSPKTKK